ncbi:ZIP zinc transporter family protein [gamma proteobacterium HTCC5015]|nr:ZIP zinc transporter family protein [gamma proteobacterium HTCC5015]
MDWQLLAIVFAAAGVAGLAMPLGGALANIGTAGARWMGAEVKHSVIAFGGGALLSAVALVLIPESVERVSVVVAAVCFVAGGMLFMGFDVYLNRRNTPASQLVAMLSDFIPESIALGAAFATGDQTAYLLAALIALQNLPEGFNAYCELREAAHFSGRKILGLFALLALLGPIAAVAGTLWLAQLPVVVAVIMLFASGGILYSVFQDIAPQARLERHYAPPMGAVLGFVLGLVGYLLTH